MNYSAPLLPLRSGLLSNLAVATVVSFPSLAAGQYGAGIETTAQSSAPSAFTGSVPSGPANNASCALNPARRHHPSSALQPGHH
jgi:hypothetical protein